MEDKTGLEKVFEDFTAKMTALVDSVLPKAEVSEAPKKEEKMAAMPAGEYQMADGSVIVVDESGMIVEVKMPEAPAETEDQKMIKALQSELETLKAAAAAQTETSTKAVQALGTLQKEFEELRKKTIGDSKPPKAAATFKKEPISESEDDNGWAKLSKVIIEKTKQ